MIGTLQNFGLFNKENTKYLQCNEIALRTEDQKTKRQESVLLLVQILLQLCCCHQGSWME